MSIISLPEGLVWLFVLCLVTLSLIDQSSILNGITIDAIDDTLALAVHIDELIYYRYWLVEHLQRF